MAFDACRATVAFLRQAIELLVTSHEHLSASILTKDELQTLCDEATVMESSLRVTLGDSNIFEGISQLVVSLKEDLEVLLRKEKLYSNATLMDSLLRNPLGESYDRSQIREVVISTKMDLKPLFCRKEFREVCDKLNLVDSLLEFSWGECDYFRSPIRQLLITIKTKLEEELGPAFRKEFQKLYEAVSLTDSLLVDSLRQTCSSRLMGEFQNRIEAVAHEVKNHIHFMQEAPVMFDMKDPSALIREWRGFSKQSLNGSKLLHVAEEVASINEELKEFHKVSSAVGKLLPQNLEDSESTTDKLIGRDDDLIEMLDLLTESSSTFRVFQISGMAGVGKTTFAKQLFNHPDVISHFDVRAWVNVSQKYKLRGLLLGLISCVPEIYDEIEVVEVQLDEMDEEQLKVQLSERLKRKRYLIVLDDVWDKQLQICLETAFPNEENGSRILLTRRSCRGMAPDVIGNLHRVHHGMDDMPWLPHRRELDIYGDLPCVHHSMDVMLWLPRHMESYICCHRHYLRYLDQDDSWKLLCSKIFGDEPCPIELLPIGKEIANGCHGFPLAINVAGHRLSRMKKTLQVWEEVAQKVHSIVMNYPRFYNTLAFSFNDLPDPLKSCFLYTGIFPQDYEIPMEKLICLWIAEGFVKSIEGINLEGVAEYYLGDLNDRGLIMLEKRGSNVKIKINHLWRELCLKESQKENFLHVFPSYWEAKIKYAINHPELHYPQRPRRLAIDTNLGMFFKIGASWPSTRSFFCFKAHEPINLEDCSATFCKALEILDLTNVQLISLPSWLQLLCKLKYLALTVQNSVSLTELSELHNLQTCIIDGEWIGQLSRELWDMSELRHISLKRTLLISHQRYASKGLLPILQNLQSLSTIVTASCTTEIFLSMPNLKKLGVCATKDEHRFCDWFENLVHLRKLETLKFTFANPFASSQISPEHLPSCDVFLSNLKKLTLSGTSLPWEDMRQLSTLRYLQVLKLKNFAFSGAIWNPGNSKFIQLKFLLIDSTDLEVWLTDNTNFPNLEHLVLRHCISLRNIPPGLGENWSLREVELHCCPDSVATSAELLRRNSYGLVSVHAAHEDERWRPNRLVIKL